jgi:glycerol-3-phosphate dehydrogenase
MGHQRPVLEEIQRGRSERYLPGVALPTDWKTQPDFKKAIGGAECHRAGGSVAGVPRGFGKVERASGNFCQRDEGNRI